jgi:hypothetical protein
MFIQKAIAMATFIALVLGLSDSAVSAERDPSMSSITSTSFGAIPVGAEIELFTLRNKQGMQAKIATNGGILTSLTVPDRNGGLTAISVKETCK